MITPDTIITAELLAGLMQCPFCGAGRLHCTQHELTLECGTYMRLGRRAERDRGIGCYESENERLIEQGLELRARVLSLESKVQRLTEAGDALAPWCYSESVFNAWTKAKEGV